MPLHPPCLSDQWLHTMVYQLCIWNPCQFGVVWLTHWLHLKLDLQEYWWKELIHQRRLNSSLSCNSMDWILSVKSLESLTKDEVCPVYTLRFWLNTWPNCILKSHKLKLYDTLGNLPCVFLVDHKILWVDWNYLWGAVDCNVTEPIGDLYHVFPWAYEVLPGLVCEFGQLSPCKAGRHLSSGEVPYTCQCMSSYPWLPWLSPCLQ